MRTLRLTAVVGLGLVFFPLCGIVAFVLSWVVGLHRTTCLHHNSTDWLCLCTWASDRAIHTWDIVSAAWLVRRVLEDNGKDKEQKAARRLAKDSWHWSVYAVGFVVFLVVELYIVAIDQQYLPDAKGRGLVILLDYLTSFVNVLGVCSSSAVALFVHHKGRRIRASLRATRHAVWNDPSSAQYEVHLYQTMVVSTSRPFRQWLGRQRVVSFVRIAVLTIDATMRVWSTHSKRLLADDVLSWCVAVAMYAIPFMAASAVARDWWVFVLDVKTRLLEARAALAQQRRPAAGGGPRSPQVQVAVGSNAARLPQEADLKQWEHMVDNMREESGCWERTDLFGHSRKTLTQSNCGTKELVAITTVTTNILATVVHRLLMRS